MPSKQSIRQAMLHLLKSQDPLEKKVTDRQIINALLEHPVYLQATVVATFLSMEHELDTHAFITRALKDGKEVVIPKVISKDKMIFVEYDAKNLKKSSFGIWEPSSNEEVPTNQIDMIHVPGLAFSAEGYRIGYGGGYYDRYLKEFCGDTISTLYPWQICSFAKEVHDVAVQNLIY